MVALCFYSQLNAQQKTSNTLSETPTADFIRFEQHITALQLANDRNILQLGTNDNLEIISVNADKIGFSHHRYQQTYKGIPIEGAVYIMHEKDSRVTHANGKLVRNIDMTVTPSITEVQALQQALSYMNGEVYAWESNKQEATLKQLKNQESATYYPSGKLVIISPDLQLNVSNYALAYKFDVYSLKPLSRKNIYIDAHEGIVLQAIDKIHSCTHIPVTAKTEHYGNSIGFDACYNGQLHSLKNEELGNGFEVFNDNNSGEALNNSVVSLGNYFQSHPIANEVFWGIEKTHYYFANYHSRNTLYNTPIHAYVHYGSSSGSAFWNEGQVFIPDGEDNNFEAYSTIDIVAHEIVHGITEIGANLIYAGESGALNESFSDIFGEVVEYYYHPIENDWIIGGDVIDQSGKDGIRNMANPNDTDMTTRQPDTYLGDFWLDNNTSTSTLIHTNSGVQNHWFYLLVEGGSGVNDNGYPYDIQGIGIDKAAAVAYLNLTEYLTPAAGYLEAREGAIMAAETLQGTGVLTPVDVQQVRDAWCAVGVGNCIPPTCRERDSLALVAIYRATDSLGWTNSWNLSTSIDTWYGVTLGTGGCVSNLDLSGNNLYGNLPTELRNLTRLMSMNLSGNSLTAIPNGIDNFAILESLNLSNNDFSSTISNEFGYLPNLKVLNLSGCSFGGEIPSSISNLDNLTTLNLANNNLSGAIPIELVEMSSLNSLYVHDNQFIFDIEAFNSMASIPDYQYAPQDSLITHFLVDRLYVESGGSDTNNTYVWYRDGIPIDTIVGNSTYVGVTITPGWYRCEVSNSIVTDASDTYSNLVLRSKAVYVGPFSPRMRDSLALVAIYHALNGPNWQNTWDLNDPMDEWFSDIVLSFDGTGEVILLSLSNADKQNIQGKIPPEIGNLLRLDALMLSDIEGLSESIIPPEVGNLTNLTTFSIDNCDVGGEIPREIGNLSNLSTLIINNTNVTGSIPAEIGNLVSLSSLAIANNNITGSIPPEIGNLVNLLGLAP